MKGTRRMDLVERYDGKNILDVYHERDESPDDVKKICKEAGVTLTTEQTGPENYIYRIEGARVINKVILRDRVTEGPYKIGGDFFFSLGQWKLCIKDELFQKNKKLFLYDNILHVEGHLVYTGGGLTVAVDAVKQIEIDNELY